MSTSDLGRETRNTEGNASYGGKRIDGQDAVMQAGEWEGTGLTGSVSRCFPYMEERADLSVLYQKWVMEEDKNERN